MTSQSPSSLVMRSPMCSCMGSTDNVSWLSPTCPAFFRRGMWRVLTAPDAWSADAPGCSPAIPLQCGAEQLTDLLPLATGDRNLMPRHPVVFVSVVWEPATGGLLWAGV